MTRRIRELVARAWAAARKSKDEYWRARVARLGALESFRISEELRQQALLQHPGWPSLSDRREDLLSHVHLAELLHRAGPSFDAIRRA